MQVIPVIDLLNGQAVHAVKGERKNYQPVQSVLCKQPGPVAIARSFRSRLGLNEMYIADLNAIQYGDRWIHRPLISHLASNEKMDIILDAGISEIEDAVEWLNLGIRRVVIGAETLHAFEAIKRIPEEIFPNRAIFSLDLRSGRILSSCAELSAMSPLEALDYLQSAGWNEVILLDLSRVGSESGIDLGLVNEARRNFPQLNLFVGGGISNYEQLLELRTMGAAGVLLATVLHSGIVTEQHLSAIS